MHEKNQSRAFSSLNTAAQQRADRRESPKAGGGVTAGISRERWCAGGRRGDRPYRTWYSGIVSIYRKSPYICGIHSELFIMFK